MRSAFRGYYPPTLEELDDLRGDALVVFDASVLLGLFGASPAAREGLLDALEQAGARAWAPRHVAWDFMRGRLGVPLAQARALEAATAAFEAAGRQLHDAIAALRPHSEVAAAELTAVLDTMQRETAGVIAKQCAAANTAAHEKTFESITRLFEGKTGPKYTAEQRAALKAEWAATQQPGGGATGELEYGDLIVWRQMLEKAAEAKRSMVFVTEAGNDHWWFIREGESHGPRPELVEAYYAATGGKRVHFFTPEEFLGFARAEI